MVVYPKVLVHCSILVNEIANHVANDFHSPVHSVHDCGGFYSPCLDASDNAFVAFVAGLSTSVDSGAKAAGGQFLSWVVEASSVQPANSCQVEYLEHVKVCLLV